MGYTPSSWVPAQPIKLMFWVSVPLQQPHEREMLPGGGEKADLSVYWEAAARSPTAQVGLTHFRRHSSAGRGSKIREQTYMSQTHI